MKVDFDDYVMESCRVQAPRDQVRTVTQRGHLYRYCCSRYDRHLMVKAKNWSSFLSEESKARENSPLKALANHLTIPGLISLGGGYAISCLLTLDFRTRRTSLLLLSMFAFRL